MQSGQAATECFERWQAGSSAAANEDRSGDFKRWRRAILSHDATRGVGPLCAPLPPGVATASRADFEDAGFGFSDANTRYGSTYPHDHVERVEFSPTHVHRAITLHYHAWPGAMLWVNEVCVLVPIDDRDYPLLDCCGSWIDDHTYAIAIGGLDHPLDVREHADRLGSIRGLLIYDANHQRSCVCLPREDEVWTAPVAQRDRHQPEKILIYASAEARSRVETPRIVVV
jgi:hypothetical protein